MEQRGGFGRFVLYVVLGVVGVVIGIWLLGQVISFLLSLVWYAVIIGAIVGVTMLVIRAARRSLSGGSRPRLPR